MKKYILLAAAGFVFLGCSSKNSVDIRPVSGQSPQVKNAINDYLKAKNDPTLQNAASEELFKASKIAKVLSSTSDPKLANHYAYLLENQVKIARLTKKKLDEIDELNDIITKRNQAIEDAKHQNDLDDEEVNTLPLEDQNSIKEKFSYQNQGSYETFTISGRYFDNDEVVLNRDLRSFIGYLTDYLQNNPTKIVILTSFTDGVGSEAYSVDMALRRANRIKEELVDHDIDEDRIKVDAKGAVNFIASNDSEDGRRKNNRIIVKIK